MGIGDIGVRCAVQLASSAFLASATGASDLIGQILPGRSHVINSPAVIEAKLEWSQGHA